LIVVTRHRPADVEFFIGLAHDAFDALAGRPGFRSARLGRSAEDPTTFLVSIEWADAGSYRRSLSPVDIRVRVLPLYNSASGEDSVFEVVYGVNADHSIIDRLPDRAELGRDEFEATADVNAQA